MRTVVEERSYCQSRENGVQLWWRASGRCVVKSALALAVASGIEAQALRSGYELP